MDPETKVVHNFPAKCQLSKVDLSIPDVSVKPCKKGKHKCINIS